MLQTLVNKDETMINQAATILKAKAPVFKWI